jgi:uncharacterized protein YlxP (DUF503 family)
MPIGLLTLYIVLPGCSSLKEKRSRLKPLIARLHKEFNISVAEIDHLDVWDQSIIACAQVSNNKQHTQRVLQRIITWLDTNWPDIELVDEQIELI